MVVFNKENKKKTKINTLSKLKERKKMFLKDLNFGIKIERKRRRRKKN